MFKLFKYLLLASLYKKAKTNFVILSVCFVMLILSWLMLDDLIPHLAGMNVFIFLTIKWVSIILLLGVMWFNILHIFNIATNPLNSQEDEVTKTKKNKILTKDKLFTKSDLIMQKYTKD